MTDNETRYREALKKIRKMAHSEDALYYFDLANEALDPVELQEYEDVEVVRYYDEFANMCITEDRWNKHNNKSCFVKLTGTYRKPIKKKVKRSRTFKNIDVGQLYNSQDFDEFTCELACKADVMIEWEEEE